MKMVWGRHPRTHENRSCVTIFDPASSRFLRAILQARWILEGTQNGWSEARITPGNPPIFSGVQK